MSDFERGAEQPPEITVMDTTGFNESFPLDVSIDRRACGAFMVECGVEPAETAGVSVSVTSRVCIRGQMIEDETGVGSLQFIDRDTVDRNITFYAGSVMKAIVDASEERTQLPLPTMQRLVNRELGIALSCCGDDMTIGFDGVLKEIKKAKAVMRRAALIKRIPVALGGNGLSLAVSQAATGSLWAGSLAAGILSGMGFMQYRDFLRRQYIVTDTTEGWPYQLRAKERVTDLIEAPNASPLVTFDWKSNR